MKAGIRLKCCSHSFFPKRQIKKAAEIKAIQQSVQATEEIMREFRQILIDSRTNAKGVLEYNGKLLTSDFLRSELEGNFKRMGYSAYRTIFAHGPQGAEPDRGEGVRRFEGVAVRLREGSGDLRQPRAGAAVQAGGGEGVPPGRSGPFSRSEAGDGAGFLAVDGAPSPRREVRTARRPRRRTARV